MTEGAQALSGEAPGNDAIPVAPVGDPAAAPVVAPVGGDPAAPTPVDTPWYHGASEEDAGYAQNKGWKGPLDVLTGYRNIEKLMGVPEDQIAKIPGPEDDDGWNALHDKMGRPETADKYEVAMPEEGGSEELSEWFKTAAHESGLSQRQVTAMVPLWNAKMAEMGEAMGQEQAAQSEASMQSLKGEWGSQWDKNHTSADQAIRMLGISDERLQPYKDAGLGADMLKLFADIGQRVQEDKFVSGTTSTQLGTSPEAAGQQIAELKMNKDFMEAYMNSEKPGHAEAVSKMKRLYGLANPE